MTLLPKVAEQSSKMERRAEEVEREVCKLKKAEYMRRRIGEETVDMISSAMLNGHSGSMSTGHANNPTDMLHRLETMMLMGIDLPLQAIQRQVASALDIIIHLGRLRDKTRKVLQIVEVEGYEDGRIQTKVLYEFKEEGMKNGKIQGYLMKKNEITNKEKLLAAGYHTV